MGGKISAGLPMAALLSLVSGSGAWASLVPLSDVIGTIVPPGGTVILDANGDVVQELTTTGISFTNLSQAPGVVSVEFIQGPPLQQGDRLGGGFLLLDGTLRIGSNVPPGEQRIRIRIGYDGTRLARAGLRADSLRLLRRRILPGRSFARWLPAVQAIRGRADIRRFPNTHPQRSPGRIGNFGFDGSIQFVWAYLDVTSDYAVGARAIPEPVSLGLLTSGLGLLALRRYRRHF